MSHSSVCFYSIKGFWWKVLFLLQAETLLLLEFDTVMKESSSQMLTAKLQLKVKNFHSFSSGSSSSLVQF